MKRNWKMLGLPAILFALVAAVPAWASQIDGPEADKGDSVAKQLRDIKKSIEDIGKDMRTNALTFQQVIKDLTDLQKQVADLRQEVDTLKKRPGGSISLYPPNSGTVQLVNEYPQAMEFVVNQTVYRVLPGQTAKISLPLGNFSFRVLSVPGFELPQNRVLVDDKPYIIRVHPQ